MHTVETNLTSEFLNFELPITLGEQRRVPFMREMMKPLSMMDTTEPEGTIAPHPKSRAVIVGFPEMEEDDDLSCCSDDEYCP
jgi:hypothetical protein